MKGGGEARTVYLIDGFVRVRSVDLHGVGLASSMDEYTVDRSGHGVACLVDLCPQNRV